MNDTLKNAADEADHKTEESGALTESQGRALEAVLSHRTLKEAAFAAGISEPTLWRYMKEKEFARRLSEARREVLAHVVARLQQAASDAVAVLQEVMMKGDAPAAARITAARAVIDYSLRAHEDDDLRARIDELEEYLRARQEEGQLAAAREQRLLA